MSIKCYLTLFWQCSCLDLIFQKVHFRELATKLQKHVLVKISSSKISYNIYNIYNRNLRNDAESMFREREKNRVGAMVLATFLINIFFLVIYVNIQPSFSKTRTEYFNIKTRETVNVSTIAVVHYFSQWASFWSICDCKNFTKLVPSQTPSRSSHWSCSVKKVVLKKLVKFYRKTSVLESFLIKLQACKFIKKRCQHRCFWTTASALPRIYKT